MERYILTKEHDPISKKLVYDWVLHWNELASMVNRLIPYNFVPNSGMVPGEAEDAHYRALRAWMKRNEAPLLKLWKEFCPSSDYIHDVLELMETKAHKENEYDPDPFTGAYSPETLYDLAIEANIQEPGKPWCPELIWAKRAYERFWGMGVALDHLCKWIYWPDLPPNMDELTNHRALTHPLITQIGIVSYENTCWGPMIADLLQTKLTALNPLANYEVDFGGLCEAKQPLSKRAIQAMQERGIDMSDCEPLQFHPVTMFWADIILTLNDEVFDQLMNAYPDYVIVYTIQEYANEKQGLVFPEPCGDKAFDDAVKKIDVITDKLAEKINGQFEIK
ncbi:MAG: hypothetical protein PHI10_04265 [Dehalococcoidales bacterium]|jgi:protein-tyrosine-phosphatase|nr:hypothetical protein [Dehalococcoidales bacterium]